MVRPNFKSLYLFAFPASLVLMNLWVGSSGMISIESAAQWIWLRCPVSWLFDILCPTCGLGRSLIAAWTFQWELAFRYHWLGVVLVLAAALFWVWCLRPFQVRSSGLQSIVGRLYKVRSLLILVYVIWGFGRNL